MSQGWIGLAFFGFLIFGTFLYMTQSFKRQNWIGGVMAILAIILWLVLYRAYF